MSWKICFPQHHGHSTKAPKLLKAIASEGKIDGLLNQSFLGKYNLGAASSVKSAAKALVETELLLLDSNGFYQIYDRFFGIWLRKL